MSATIEAQRVCDELTLAQVHDALGYYYDHPCEIEQYIAENKAALERV